MGPRPDSAPPARSSELPKYALGVLAVLTAINFVNYIDRYVVSAVAETIATDFGLEDDITGFVGSAFMIAYTVVAPLSGWLGDRIPRKTVTAVAVGAWSLATLGSAWAPSLEWLLVMRALVGIGEAGYASVAPSMIADLFTPDRRGRMLAWFYLAIPLGSAFGYLLGGWVGENWGWRAAFAIASVPGLVLAVVAAFLPEPQRGRFDPEPRTAALSLRVAFATMRASRDWVLVTIGMTLMTFAMGGIAFWMPTFLQREPHELGEGLAATVFGGITVVAGLLGTAIGGVLGDRAETRRRGGYLVVSGWGLLLAAPFVAMMPLLDHLGAALACAFVAEVFLFLNTGPLNAALVGCVPAAMRATAVSINVFCIHAFGDAGSPYVLGLLSRSFNLAWAIAFCAIPVALGGLVLTLGVRHRPP